MRSPRRSPEVMYWIFYGISFTISVLAACQRHGCTVKQFHFSRERDSFENYALYGFTFKSLTVTSHKNCFEQCAWDCRCVSFNYLITASHNNCQLNNENRYLKPDALKQMEGHSYHELGIDYNVKEGLKCADCHNGCCDSNTCLNGGTCVEICDVNNKRFQCNCRPGYTGTYCGTALRSCTDVKRNGGKTDGVYTIDPGGNGAFNVFCNHIKDGEAWAVIQRRLDGSVDFYRGWEDYKRGFGDLRGEFWLGLEKIARLTNQTRQRLRVEMEDFTGYSCFAEYDLFIVNGENDGYRLASLGNYRGSCPDSFTYNIGSAFSTKDKDADSYASNCAVDHQGAWWYRACTQTNLNGQYTLTGGHLITGIYWYMTSNKIELLKKAEMKIELLE